MGCALAFVLVFLFCVWREKEITELYFVISGRPPRLCLGGVAVLNKMKPTEVAGCTGNKKLEEKVVGAKQEKKRISMAFVAVFTSLFYCYRLFLIIIHT